MAYHAAWFKVTGLLVDGTAIFQTFGSAYDTQIAVFGGSCGSLFQVGYNDNWDMLKTSLVEVDLVGGTDYYVLVAGYGPDDGGLLQFEASFTPHP